MGAKLLTPNSFIDVDMKFSRYNIHFEEGGQFYLYNTLSTALIQIDEKIVDLVLRNDCTAINETHFSELVRMHFIVEDDSDEVAEYLYYFNSVKYRLSACSLGIIFIPTYSCNLCCPYCLQGQSKSHTIIDDESLFAIFKFIEKQINKSRDEGSPIRQINASIFGGEPLVAKNSAIKFCEGIANIANKNRCKINFLMTTNATLIDDEIIFLIKKFNIGIQVSIDGNRSQHDKSRIRHDGSGTYDCIINNLKRLNENGLKKNVVIRINSSKDNIADIEETIKDVKPFSDEIYCGFLSEFKGYNDGFSSCLSCQQYSTLLTQKIYPLYEKYGIKIYNAFGKMSPCTICTENRFVIDCNLDVYKCETLVNQQDAKVGVIDNDGKIHLNNNFYKQMSLSPMLNLKCRDCRILPYCGGGCVGKAYVNRGKKDKNFNCYICTTSESDLLNFIKDYIRRKRKV